MKLIDVNDYDVINYKKASMFLIFPNCTFKCGRKECQNSALAGHRTKEIAVDALTEHYIETPLVEAIVCGGLEPFDSWKELQAFIMYFRYYRPDDIVIYTGYTEEELELDGILTAIKEYSNIIIKFGRFIPNQKKHYDEVLGVELASPNQYARRVS